MAANQDRARALIGEFLQRAGKAREELPDELGLYGGGLELDSLEAAELSALLEDDLGTDPFTAGDELPQTVGEVVAFYPAAGG